MARPNETEMLKAPDLMEWVSQDRRRRLLWSAHLGWVLVLRKFGSDEWTEVEPDSNVHHQVMKEAVGMLLSKAVRAAEGERLLDRIAQGHMSSQRMAEWQDRYKSYVERRDAYQSQDQVRTPTADVKLEYLWETRVKRHSMGLAEGESSRPVPPRGPPPEGYVVDDSGVGAWRASGPCIIEEGKRSTLITWQRLCRKEVQDGMEK